MGRFLGDHSSWITPNEHPVDVRATCGQRFFVGTLQGGTLHVKWKEGVEHCFLDYRCKHCEKSSKIYALRISLAWQDGSGAAIKVGESPSFGERTPSRVITLIGPDKDLFLNGRKAENHGLGIGASAYYRRVVEKQKDHIFDEIIKVARRLEVGEEEIKKMEAAKADYRFDRGIDNMKMFMPESLKIKGHNPLTLLHGALSKDIHKKSDEECLALARSVRVILTELAERISVALQEKKEIDDALADLLKRAGEA